jgi:chitinase
MKMRPTPVFINVCLRRQELRKELDKRGLMLSANLVAYPSIAKSAFDAAQLAKYVDFLSVPAFDYHGSWERVTGHTAPLNSADSLNVVSYKTLKKVK